MDRGLAHGVFRFTLGINRLIHGVDRRFGLGAGEFAAMTSSEFAGTPLPHSLVMLSSWSCHSRWCVHRANHNSFSAQTSDVVFDSGKLVTDVGTVLPLEEARTAHEMLEGAPHKRGKIVLGIAA
jgi:hypothetical protein